MTHRIYEGHFVFTDTKFDALEALLSSGDWVSSIWRMVP